MDENFQKAALQLQQHLKSQRKESLSKRLRPFFLSEEDLRAFLSNAMEIPEAHRMLLHLDWYAELADLVETVRPERSPLKLIFLLAGAEFIIRERVALEKNRDVANSMNSWDAILKFFEALSQENRDKLLRGIRRPLGDERGVEFSLKEVIKILWQARNDAAHGIDFYTFQIPQSNEIADGGLITEGRMKSGESFFPLDIQITFDKIQSIVIETALSHIRTIIDPQ